jgi:uncharacterized protein YkwD
MPLSSRPEATSATGLTHRQARDGQQAATSCTRALAETLKSGGSAPIYRVMKTLLITALLGCSLATHAAAACTEDPSWKRRLLDQLNHMRAEGGVCSDGVRYPSATEPMRWSDALERAAASQTHWMVERGELLHVGRRGEGIGERVRQFAYAFERVGENVGMGFFQMDHVISAWRTSAKHCANLMDPRFTEVGLSCVRAANGPYWTIIVGRPQGSNSSAGLLQTVSWQPQ